MKHASIPGKTALLLALLLLSLLLLALPAAAVEVDASGAVPGRWTHDYPAAAALSRDQNLPLLLNFTGSDWCIWCKRMDASVFSTPLWKAYATNFALAFVDFPSDESALPPGAAERNRQLQQVHRVRGYPTFVLIAPSGTPLLQTSTDLDPESFIATLNDALGPDVPAIPDPDALAALQAAASEATAAEEAPAAPAAAPAAPADDDPFALPDDLETLPFPFPEHLSAVLDVRSLKTLQDKYVGTLDDLPFLFDVLPAPVLAAARDLDPAARLIFFFSDSPYAPYAYSIRLAFNTPDAIPTVLSALSDAGFSSVPAADLPSDLPPDLRDVIALRNPAPQSPDADDEILYLLRVDNALYIDTDPVCIAKALDASATLPPILPAEGEIVLRLCGPIPFPFLPTSYQKAFFRNIGALTFGFHLSGDLLRIHQSSEFVPGSRVKAYAETLRPPAPETSCVYLPDALLTCSVGAADAAADTALSEALGRFLSSPASPLSAYTAGQSGSFALYPPDAPLSASAIAASRPAMAAPVFLVYSSLADPAATAADLQTFLADHADRIVPLPLLDRTHRNIAIRSFHVPLDDSPFLPLAFPSLTLSYAILPSGILFGAASRQRFDAAIDAALDATIPPPDDLPAFRAAFPYPDAPAITAFHADYSAILEAYLPGYAEALAKTAESLRQAVDEDDLPFLKPDAGTYDAPAVLDLFIYLAPDHNPALRAALHIQPFLRAFAALVETRHGTPSDDTTSGSDAPILPSTLVQTNWHGYDDAIILSNEKLAAVVVPSLGRLVFLAPSLDAPNSLRFAAEPGAPIPEGEAFYNVGGDWLWPVLQSRWPSLPGADGADWPPPAILADAPWDWTIMDTDTTHALILSRNYPAPLNLLVHRVFRLVGDNLRVDQALVRTAPSSIPVTLWHVSQVPFPDEITADAANYHLMAGQLPPSAGDALIADDSCTFHIPLADADEFKLGFTAPAESLTALRDDQSFTVAQEFEDDFADTDGALQLYVNHGLGYAELETLTPEFLLPPGAPPLRNHILYTP